jgi:hypothetical protein
MITTILENGYIKPARPYSQNELLLMKNKAFNTIRIGKTRAYHTRCGHFYYVKQNGRKEKEIKQSSSTDCGNCSVCWKINKTPNHLHKTVRELIEEYTKKMYDEPKYLTYENINLLITFKKWLYE